MASFSQSFLAYFQKKNLQIILLGCLSGIPLGLLIDPLIIGSQKLVLKRALSVFLV